MFDEVITGFRLALSGVTGRAEILEMTIDGGVAFGGSFNGNPIVLAGSRAALEVLSAADGAAGCPCRSPASERPSPCTSRRRAS
jgi:glutamate-1-semialdehyde aminotransferase